MPRSPEMGPSPAASDGQKRSDARLWAPEKRKAFVRASMVAAALHAPLVPAIGKHLEQIEVQEAKDRIERLWDEPGAVLRPQSEAERTEMEERKAERAKRRDAEGQKRFQQNTAARLERGEKVTYQEIYFEGERLAGVEPERVAEGRKLANEMIQHYSSRLEHGLDDGLIRSMTQEMYDQTKHEDGQASVTGFFVDKKRNCVSYLRAQQIVFEGVIDRLSTMEQERYSLGNRKEAHHTIATLGVSEHADSPPDWLYILQPPIQRERPQDKPAGVADITERVVKQALTGKKVVVQAEKAERDEAPVNSGPRLDLVSDEPVDDGIVVEGPLRSATENRHQAEKDRSRILTEEEYERQYGVTEWDVITGEPSVEEMRQRREVAHKGGKRDALVDATDLVQPDADLIQALDWGPAAPILIGEIRFGDVSAFSPEAIDAMLWLKARELGVRLGADGSIPQALIEGLARKAPEARKHMGGFYFGWKRLHLHSYVADPDGTATIPFLHAEQLRDVFRSIHINELANKNPDGRIWRSSGVDLGYHRLTPEIVRVIQEEAPIIYVRRPSWPTEITAALGQSNATVFYGYIPELTTQFLTQPGYDRFFPDLEGMSMTDLIKLEAEMRPLAGESAQNEKIKNVSNYLYEILRAQDVQERLAAGWRWNNYALGNEVGSNKGKPLKKPSR